MGVNQLSKKLRPGDKTPDSLATSKLLDDKTCDVDLSVVLHKLIGIKEGAGQFIVRPQVPNEEVKDRCHRVCSFSKANSITLKVSVDGKYHPPMKDAENMKRNDNRNTALQSVEEMIRSHDISTHTKDAIKPMKKAARVYDYILGTAVQVFWDNGSGVFGAPYESDFQLVHWENIGFADGTYTIDSDG